MAITSINPATGKTIKSYDEMTPEQAAAAVAQAHETWRAWRATSFAERAKPMKKTADMLRKRKDALAKLMAVEMGKPLMQGAAEVEKCAWACDYYADNAEAHLAPDVIKTEGAKSYVAFEPLGVVLAIMPWNFPLWQVYRFAAPALMAGNVGMLKHASNVPGCALVIEEIFNQAGFPEGAFRSLLIGNAQVRAVIEHPLVRAVTLTGSTPAGKAVASQAGAVLKKTVLELGGSDPYVVLEDADLDQAVQTCVNSRLINAGQSCIAAKRFIVVEPVRAAFTERLIYRRRTRARGVHRALRRAHEDEEDGRPSQGGNRCRSPGAAQSARRLAQASARVGRARRTAAAWRPGACWRRRVLPADCSCGRETGHARVRRRALRPRGRDHRCQG